MFEDSRQLRVDDEDMISIPIVAWSDLTMANWAESWAISAEGKMLMNGENQSAHHSQTLP